MALQFESYAQKGHEFVNLVARELKTKDVNYAGSVTRSVLRALRNRLTIEESFQLIAQLPMAIKAVYVDGWKVSKHYERIKHIDDFLIEVLNEYGNFLPREIYEPEIVRDGVESVFKAMAHYVSAEEIADVLGVLPVELREWLKGALSV